jgi:hypothetical protein
MNEELQKALGALLNKANDGIDAASGLLTAELPDVIHQLLMWHGVYSFIMCLFGVVAALLIPKLISVMLRKPEGKSNLFWDCNGEFSREIPPALIVVFGGLFAIIFECVFIFDFINLQWLQIYIAPKVWLIEYAASLTK